MNPSYEFVLGPYNDVSGTDTVVALLPASSLAAIIVEPMQGAGGCIPGKTDFLQHLRNVATEHDAILIFDEVMTSRLAYRGLQSKLGIKPDITTLGKWAGGGMGFGAFGGRQEIMEMFDPRRGMLVHSGTFNNNTITMAAGIAGCRIYNEEAVEKLNSLGDTLRGLITTSINNYISARHGEKRLIDVTGIGSLMNITFSGPEKDILQALFYHHMLSEGIYIATRGYLALNLELKMENVEAFIRSLELFLERYKAHLR
jgi:glutamate-1-semialdehyde 2,1-aminomutase